MKTLLLEIRDRATFIPVLAVRMGPDTHDEVNDHWRKEEWLMRRAGYNLTEPPFCVILCRLEAAGCDGNATYDPYSWSGARTLPVAHLFIVEHWDELRSGDVVDVEFILKETTKQKLSERENFGIQIEGENYP